VTDFTLINICLGRALGDRVLYEWTSEGILSLAAVLKRDGFQVQVHEHFTDPSRGPDEKIAAALALTNGEAGLVGIGCHSVHLPFAVKLAERIKNERHDTRVFLGGIGPSAVARELMETFPLLDGVVVGEAEHQITEVVKRSGRDLEGVPGVVWRRRDGTVASSGPPPPVELESLPPPAFDLVDLDQYLQPVVMTSRGCHHGCDFCSLGHFWGKHVRSRPIEQVAEVVKDLVERHGVGNIFFADPTFTTDRSRVLQLCETLRELNGSVTFEVLARTEDTDEEMLRALAEAGCSSIFYGIESGSDTVRGRLGRSQSAAEVMETAARAVQFIERVEVSFIWGFPFETYDDFWATVRALEILRSEVGCRTHLQWLIPYPITTFHREYGHTLFRPGPGWVTAADPAGMKALEDTGTNCLDRDDTLAVRRLVAATTVERAAGDLIAQHPRLFPDYYRYPSPDLERKMAEVRDLGPS